MSGESYVDRNLLESLGFGSVQEYVSDVARRLLGGETIDQVVDLKLSAVLDFMGTVPVEYEALVTGFYSSTDGIDDFSMLDAAQGVDGIVVQRDFEGALVDGGEHGYMVRFGKLRDQSESWVIVANSYSMGGYLLSIERFGERAKVEFWDGQRRSETAISLIHSPEMGWKAEFNNA